MALLRASSLVVFTSVLVAAGCGDDLPVAGSDASSGSTTAPSPGSTTVVDPDSSGGAATGTTTDDGTEETGFDPPEPVCGNGYVEGDEQCDDGNDEEDDACSTECLIPCGLQWGMVLPGPTLDSVIEGRSIVRDAADRIVLSGLLREITVDMGGMVIEGDDTVLVQSHMPQGGMVWEQVLGDPGGDIRSAGVAVDDAGDVYVAATLDAADGGTAIRAYKLAAGDGGEQWVHDFDGAFVGEDEIAFGIAVGPDGRPVISGQARAGDGDDDVWLRKLDADDGSEVWTQTYSGVGSGGFSTDDGGPLAIGADGTIYVLARIYGDFQTQPGTLLSFGPDGGPPQWTFEPTIGGSNQSFTPVAVTVASDGSPVMAVSRVDGSETNFWIYQVDATGQEVWSRTRSDFEVRGAGTDWLVEGIAPFGDELVVLGRYVNDQSLDGLSWWEPWLTRMTADAEPRCQVLHQADFDGLLPPTLRGYGVATASDGSALVTGQQSSEDEAGLWLGSFRP